eukprot:NODE_482_length_1353_cov_352.495399_g348_i0.p1 GENE.NODE_482_length_1353_cov_352.495399_g348_i0~~NODE_482_length_1353_cov_352.495399_g348_i0.p1  ORF type:complete len:402 (-),score=138.74 NODE_482_length_1353_cov_352.495399_g348_i0:29-1234(-)
MAARALLLSRRLTADASSCGGLLRQRTALCRPARRPFHYSAPLAVGTIMDKRRAQERLLEEKQRQVERDLAEQAARIARERATYVPIDKVRFAGLPDPKATAQPTNPKLLACTIVGAPSAGKSSLLCALVRDKVSATSPKAGTTRRVTTGILTEGNVQVVFYDCPGFARGRYVGQLGAFGAEGWGDTDGAHALLWVHDLRSKFYSKPLVDRLAELKRKHPKLHVLVVLNKIDEVDETGQMELFTLQLRTQHPGLFGGFFPTDSHRGRGIPALLTKLLQCSRPGPWRYPSTCTSGLHRVDRVNEVIRERLFRLANHEIPYQVACRTIGWTLDASGKLKIHHRLLVTRRSHERLVTKLVPSLHRHCVPLLEAILNTQVRLIMEVELVPELPASDLQFPPEGGL